MSGYEKRILTSEKEIREWFEQNGNTFSFDTETNGQNYYDLVARSFQLCNGKAVAFIPANEETIKVLKDVFLSISTIICHNITYDLKVCKRYDIPFEHMKLYDTMVAQHLLDEESELGLKHLAEKILGKTETIHWEDVSKLDIMNPKFIQYAMDDVINTWELAKWQQKPMEEQGLVTLFREIEMPFMLCLIDMETNGMLIDRPKVEETTTSLKKKIEELNIKMHDVLGKQYEMQFDLFGNCKVVSDINFNSSQQLSEILFKDLGLKSSVVTDKGQLSVGKEAIDDLKGKHPFVDLLIQYKIAQKLLNAFFEPLPIFIEKDGRIRARFNDCGTATGRLSCTKPNLQQLPKVRKEFPIDTRSCFKVENDEVMISADYSGQELRVLAHITQEKNLIDSFIKGKDLHLSTANEFFNLNIPEKALFENGEEYETYKKKFKSERDKAKIINFGIAYGKGAFGFAQDFGTSEDEAQKILDRYFSANPGVFTAIESTKSLVQRTGYVTSITGRRRRFNKVKKIVTSPDFSQSSHMGIFPAFDTKEWEGYTKSSFRQAFNFLIQGYSADMIRMASIKCYNLKKLHPEWCLKLLATIHDEVLLSCKKKYEKECINEIKKAFETAVTLSVPLVSSVVSGSDYGACK